MGLTPMEIDRMSLWEYAACLAGWNASHGPKDGGSSADAFSDSDLDAFEGMGIFEPVGVPNA